MDISLKDTRLSLPRDGLIAVRDARGAHITCLDGGLWITQECRIKDEVLKPGQTLRVRHDGLTIVTALTPSVLILSEDRGFARAMRATLTRRLAAGLKRRLADWFESLVSRNRNTPPGREHFIRAA
jgi:hypothetical protein